MILTSNRGFAEWGEVFGDPVVATALLDRLLHHAVVIQIEGASYRLRQHADLVPEAMRPKSPAGPAGDMPRRRGRPPRQQRETASVIQPFVRPAGGRSNAGTPFVPTALQRQRRTGAVKG